MPHDKTFGRKGRLPAPRGNTSEKKDGPSMPHDKTFGRKDACPRLVAILLEKKETRQCLETRVLGKKEADLLVLILSYFEI